jgi:hypothetical protein
MLNAVRRNNRLLITALAVVVVFILWNVETLAFLLYPFRLFVTYVHEAGHGTAALLTGGEFLRFEVFPNGTGFAVTRGGSQLVILPAGYLGAALFGAVLFFLTHHFHRSRLLSLLIGIGLIGFSILFGRVSLVALIVGVLFGVVLIVLAWYTNESINTFVLSLLSILTSLNAVFDVWSLVGNSDAMLGDVRNDAAAFSATVAPLIPGSVWAFLWSLLAIIMLGVSVWLSIVRPMRKRLNLEKSPSA